MDKAEREAKQLQRRRLRAGRLLQRGSDTGRGGSARGEIASQPLWRRVQLVPLEARR